MRVEREGELLAVSARPYVLLEAPLPVRYYLPREDVSEGILQPSSTRSMCAYKGQATYWSLENEDDIAWSYPEPLREAAEVTDRVAFFNERVDLVVDGTPLERPSPPGRDARRRGFAARRPPRPTQRRLEPNGSPIVSGRAGASRWSQRG